MAYSTDGRAFAFESPLATGPAVGGFVTIALGDGRVLLGQVLETSVGDSGAGRRGSSRVLVGRGTVLSEVDEEGSRAAAPAAFDGAAVAAAGPELVAAHLGSAAGSGASLPLGRLQGVAGVGASLLARGFGRHTFLCGQSGSGKTYTLGVILERLLLETGIRVVVLDPNSDFVNLGVLRPATDGETSGTEGEIRRRYDAISAGIHVFGGEGSAHRLRARYGNLSLQQQTMVLGLDPLVDAEDYNAFLRIVRRLGGEDYSLDDVMSLIRASFDEDARRLGLRIENLGVSGQSIWARADEPLLARLPDDWRMLVADLGSLASPVEGSIASAAVLGYLWAERRSRQPTIIVIDEAHNVCPGDPAEANQALATEHVVRIAGEGRKYGLYLLLSTQRPAKVHPNVISQCDNLLLMKMNSRADLVDLARTFSYAPEGLVGLASGFELGEGLAAGKIAPTPLLFKSGQRLSAEGGGDVPSDWADAR